MKGTPLESFKGRMTKPVVESAVRALTFAPCLACGAVITGGYYGRFGDAGVCSKKCNAAQSAKLQHATRVKKQPTQQPSRQ